MYVEGAAAVRGAVSDCDGPKMFAVSSVQTAQKRADCRVEGVDHPTAKSASQQMAQTKSSWQS
jgi:hypothetical protein